VGISFQCLLASVFDVHVTLTCNFSRCFYFRQQLLHVCNDVWFCVYFSQNRRINGQSHWSRKQNFKWW